MPQNTPTVVYTCKTVTLTITGSSGTWKPPVSGVVIELKEGAIPRMFVTVDPLHTQGDAVLPAAKSTLASMEGWISKAQEYAVDPDSRAAISVQLISSVPSALDQTINVSGWLVKAAGLNGASAAGNFSVEVEIEHPAGIIDRTIAMVPNRNSEPLWSYDAYLDPLTGFTGALRDMVAAEGASTIISTITSSSDCEVIPGAQSNVDLSVVNDKAVSMLTKVADALENNLDWTTTWPGNAGTGYNNLPFQSGCFNPDNNPNMPLALQYSIPSYINLQDGSVWASLADNFLPQWQLTLVPTFWGNLQVMPFTPWANPSITIYDDEISDMNFPGVDPAPVGGAHVQFSQSGSGPAFAHWPSGSVGYNLVSDVIYISTAATNLNKPSGRIIPVAIPGWLQQCMNGDAALCGSVNSPLPGEQNSTTITTENLTPQTAIPVSSAEAAKNSPINQYAGAIYSLAYQFYLSYFRNRVEGSMSTCLLYQAAGSQWTNNYVVPGCVVRVTSRAEGTDILDFYAISVTHVLNAGKQAYSQWVGRYCRPPEGVPDAVKTGSYNPVYASQGADDADTADANAK